MERFLLIFDKIFKFLKKYVIIYIVEDVVYGK